MIPLVLFSGNGTQFLTLAVSIIVLALLGMFNVHRCVCCLFLYVCLSVNKALSLLDIML